MRRLDPPGIREAACTTRSAIGCLAIAGARAVRSSGLNLYGRTSINLAVVTIVWWASVLALVLAVTKRTRPQLWTYFATVWVTGFGTGGSHDTLPVNLIRRARSRPSSAGRAHLHRPRHRSSTRTARRWVLIVTVSTCALLLDSHQHDGDRPC